jgi:hypothetical protein
MPEQMSLEEAQKTQRNCVCSDCWGQMVAKYDKATQKFVVSCSTDGCPCNGVVSRKWVEKQESESHANLLTARQALRASLPKAAKKSESQLLAELAF